MAVAFFFDPVGWPEEEGDGYEPTARKSHTQMTTLELAGSVFSGAAFWITLGFTAAIVGSVAVLKYCSPAQKARRALLAVRRTPLGQVPDGSICKVIGTVVLGSKSLGAPLSERVCVHYDLQIVESRTDAGGHEVGGMVIHEAESCDFVVRDGTDIAHVDMAKARIAGVIGMSLRSGAFNEAIPRRESFLASRDKTGKKWIFNRSHSYFERVVEPGMKVAILGILNIEPASEANAVGEGSRGVERQRVLRAPPDGELVVSVDPKVRK